MVIEGTAARLAYDSICVTDLGHVSKRRGKRRQALLGIGQALSLFVSGHDNPTANFFDIAPAALAHVLFNLAYLNARRGNRGIHHAAARATFAGQKA